MADMHSTELPHLVPCGKGGENMQVFPQQHFLNKLAKYANWFHRQTQVVLHPTFSLNRTSQENTYIKIPSFCKRSSYSFQKVPSIIPLQMNYNQSIFYLDIDLYSSVSLTYTRYKTPYLAYVKLQFSDVSLHGANLLLKGREWDLRNYFLNVPLSNTVDTSSIFLYLQHFVSSLIVLPYPGHSRKPERGIAQAEQDSMYICTY